MSQPNANNQKPPRAGKRRGPIRRSLRFLIITLFVLIATAAVLHTVIIREVAQRTLAAQIGCGVSIGTTRLGSGGAVVLRDVRLRAPGIDGKGGVFLESASVTAQIDWTTLLGGGQGVRRMVLNDPVVRLSQDASTGALNLLRVGGAPSGGGSGQQQGAGRSITPLPEVEFHSGRVEFGEHNDTSYNILASIPMKGQVGVPTDSIPAYEIDLVEIVEDDSRPPMRLTGDFNVGSLEGELKLVDLDLDRWQGWSAPVSASALWKQMNIRGRVSEASFTATRDSSVDAWFTLDGVRLTVPIQSSEIGAKEIRASDVDGVIRFTQEGLSAQLDGIIEDLPAKMEFKTDGLRINAPLTCTITTDRFLVSEDPGLLRFIPQAARQLFDEYGGPTGEVSGYVTLSRGAPMGEGAAPIIARGELQIDDGTGKHEAFPYPVRSLRGAIRFDEHEIELIDINGASESGAAITATGTISPPADGTDVAIELLISDVPTDEALFQAIPSDARSVIRTLFHEPALEGLRQRGLLLTSADRESITLRLAAIESELRANQPGGEGSAVRRVALQRETESIEERLRLPVFDLGGRAKARVLIERDGPEDTLHTTIDIRVDQAGLLPEAFSYPFVATDLHIFIDDDGVTATTERLDGLTGASADLIAAISFPNEAREEPGTTLIEIGLEHAPVDSLLLAATPAPGDENADNLFDALGSLDVEGELTGAVLIDSAVTDEFSANLNLTGIGLALAGSSANGREPLRAHSLSGPMTVTDSRVLVGPITGTFEGSPLTVRGYWRESTDNTDPSPILAEIDLLRFDITSPIDPVIALLGEDAALRWANLRDTNQISGTLDLTTSIRLTPGESPTARTTIRNVKDLSFATYDTKFDVARLGGEILVDTDSIRIINCTGAALIDDRLTGRLSINANLGLTADGETSIEAELIGAVFDTPLLERIGESLGDPASFRNWLGQRRPSGECDLRLLAQRPADAPMDWKLELTPRLLDLRSGDETLRLLGTGGTAIIDAGGGEIDGVRLVGDGLGVDMTGSWRLGDLAGVDLEFTIDADRLGPGAHLLTPPDVASLIDSLEIGIDEQWRLTRGELRWRTDSYRFIGEGSFEGLRCNPGISVTDAKGDIVMLIERAEELTEPEIEIEITTEHMQLASVEMTDGLFHLQSGDLPGRLIVDDLAANTHGGRISGTVTIDTISQAAEQPNSGTPDEVWYEAEFDFAGVEVESLLNETSRIGEGPDLLAENAGQKTPIEGFTGRFDGRLSIAGTAHEERTRRGRGVFRIDGGELLMAPLTVPIIELSNLQPPSGEALERADAEIYVDGSSVHVELLRFRSDSISIVGDGLVTWPGLGLNMEFRSRSNNRIPIISDLVEGFRDELITTFVTGTLLAPDVRAEVLPGAR